MFSVQFILATIHDYEIQHKRNYYMAREPRRNPEAYRTWTALYMKNIKQKELTCHWTKKWIYLKFGQHKDVANICLLLSKSVADMVNATFAAIFTLVRKCGSKCGIYHVCFRFALE